LIPDKDESVNFGETGNIFIEGEKPGSVESSSESILRQN